MFRQRKAGTDDQMEKCHLTRKIMMRIGLTNSQIRWSNLAKFSIQIKLRTFEELYNLHRVTTNIFFYFPVILLSIDNPIFAAKCSLTLFPKVTFGSPFLVTKPMTVALKLCFRNSSSTVFVMSLVATMV